MQYILLIYTNEAKDAEQTPEQQEASFGEWMAYTAALQEAGAYVAGDALQGVATATSVRVREGEQMITDGPFAETKEQLGGYYVVDVANLDAAIEWAARCPGAKMGTMEVRPVMVFDT
ncbi:YciI family protein [Pseudenhygromyxa sp. WMMC2535]|uniref:YciI family protein n=1 Tax=Pseudenhygromyxa sp. WMMC2535 TaxID=2712867 RepID=UPI001557C402|nr:YciI family protein [Pseudenhygromyxa sp. WMMC2535]NVB39275.1 YciI family protein [Pseudenhygromyxa sp. WMMC2535]